MKRREFLSNSAFLLGAAALFSGCGNKESKMPPSLPNTVTRRKFKDIYLPLLSLGCLRLPMKNNKIDMTEFQSMVDYCMAHGVNYFDSSYFYIAHESEIAIGKALKNYKREDYYLATKINPNRLKSRDDFKVKFNKQLTKLQTDYLDFYLAHAIHDEDSYNKFLENEMYEELVNLKEEGKIKYIGFSFHGTAELLKKITNRHKFDFCYLMTNYYNLLGQDDDIRKQHKIVHSKNIPVIAMEPLFGGRLVHMHNKAIKVLKDDYPNITPAEFGLKWAAGQDNVVSLMSGMNNLEQVKQNVKYFIDFKKIEDTKHTAQKIINIMEENKVVNCTGCTYCLDICPNKVDIANIFTLYNKYQNNQTDLNSKALIAKLQDYKKTTPCNKCGKCTKVCPQTIDVAHELEQICQTFNV